jgi:hypothetical protein
VSRLCFTGVVCFIVGYVREVSTGYFLKNVIYAFEDEQEQTPKHKIGYNLTYFL